MPAPCSVLELRGKAGSLPMEQCKTHLLKPLLEAPPYRVLQFTDAKPALMPSYKSTTEETGAESLALPVPPTSVLTAGYRFCHKSCISLQDVVDKGGKQWQEP